MELKFSIRFSIGFACACILALQRPPIWVVLMEGLDPDRMTTVRPFLSICSHELSANVIGGLMKYVLYACKWEGGVKKAEKLRTCYINGPLFGE